MREKKDEHEDKEEEEGIGRRLLGRFDPFERVPIAKTEVTTTLDGIKSPRGLFWNSRFKISRSFSPPETGKEISHIFIPQSKL